MLRFNLLKIEKPDVIQLENVEKLQKQLRTLQKLKLLSDEKKNDVNKLCKNIIQVLEYNFFF